jgi:hypothetical protein
MDNHNPMNFAIDEHSITGTFCCGGLYWMVRVTVAVCMVEPPVAVTVTA